jgi:hypothetical protein
VPADGLELYVSSGLSRHLPEHLELALRGLGRKHVTAYWNGLPWVQM